MARRIRRIVLVGVILAVLAAVVTAATRRGRGRPVVAEPAPRQPQPAPPAAPPPVADRPAERIDVAALIEGPPRWVLPQDGSPPRSHPVKVKVSSGIYHLPGGRFYDRTVPDRCYADAESAEADGYRRAKA